MDTFQLTTPVAFIIFNRPDTTKVVFEEIRRAKPTKLYLISDAAREDRPKEKEKVDETRNYVETHIDWDCEVHKDYARNNLGDIMAKHLADGLSGFHQLHGCFSPINKSYCCCASSARR